MHTSGASPSRLAHRYAAFSVVVVVLSCALAAGGSGVARTAPVPALWVMTELGTLAGTGGSFAYGVNNRGQVVGESWTKDREAHAFLWESGRMRDLGTLPGYDLGSIAQAINDRGQIVGVSRGSSRKGDHAFLWQNGKLRDLGTLGGKRSYATAINKRGQVVGTSTTKAGKEHAFLWQNGKMHDIGDFWPAAINDRGQVVGPSKSWHAEVWENGALRELGPSRGQSQPSGINERGRIVGALRGGFGGLLTGCGRLILWTGAGASFADAEALRRNPCVGGNLDVGSRPAINERGQVAATGNDHAYLWEKGTRFDLGTLPGDPSSYAVAINNQGWIVGASGDDSTSGKRAVLWTPRKVG